MNEHRRAVGRSAIVAAVRASGKDPGRSLVTVFGDAAIEENPVNASNASLADTDCEVHAALERERERQTVEIELIASENIVSRAVREALGHEITNKTLEGYPGRRFHGGGRHVDVIERLAIERAQDLFGVPTSRPVETPLVASVEGRGERPGRVVQALGRTPQRRCQRSRAALVRRVPPLPSSNVASLHDGSPIHTGSHAWRGGKRLGYTAFEPRRGLEEGVIASLRGQRSLRLGARRTKSTESGNSETTRSRRSNVCSGTELNGKVLDGPGERGARADPGDRCRCTP